ncbi:response regulator [Actinocrispum wychmicini]|uniref:DNA-binding NarL/FixJ family response regulator n=1 Tax=Actinocrispum wychmicini TaxID=1213861 RepID=A0A4R2K767_9PSEU|nr:response regulator transcription factor [Actinocrispum wychmicini]TCO65789.1 DNA-binding NarL/FixJ family response regulator [Actinocrispum wychmicini]
MTVRVLVVDDQELVRDGIASLLDIQDGIEVVAVASNGKEAIEQANVHSPDVVLLDVRMPEMDGVEAAQHLASTCKVVMLTTFDDEQYVVQALRAGAVGYLLKDLPTQELAEAVRLAHAGIAQLHPAIVKGLAGVRRPVVDDVLTARETEVLRVLATGATNKEIAQQLYLSEGTVKNHVSRILNRLGLRDRTQAAMHARDLGLL